MKIRENNINTQDFWDRRHTSKDGTHNRDVTKQFRRFFTEGFVPEDKKISVLDVACGEVLYVQEFDNKKEYPEISFHALDISPEVAKKNKELSPRVETYSINVSTEEIPGFYDYIVSMHSFEHFEDPVLVLNKCLKICYEKVIICVPYLDAWSNDPSHLHKFSLEDPFSGYESYKILNDGQEIFYVFKGLAVK